MKFSTWPYRQGARKSAAKRAKPLDAAAIRAQAVESLMLHRGLTREQAGIEYDRMNGQRPTNP